MTPKAVPVAPLGLWARQCHAEADVEAAAAIIAPKNIATTKRLMIALPDVYARNSRLSFIQIQEISEIVRLFQIS